MIWQHLFLSTILNRGKDYYRKGKVKILDESNGGYLCLVRGSKPYSVYVGVEDDKVTNMSCTCPYAKDGHNCKHMAAVLYKINEGSSSARSQKKEDKTFINKFPKEETSKAEYQYFDTDEILKDLKIYRSTFKESMELVNSRKFTLENISLSYRNGVKEPVLYARGTFKSDGRDHNVIMEFTKDRLMNAVCYCPSCTRSYYGYYWNDNREVSCKHIGALLILTNRYIIANNLGDETDYVGNRLLKAYKTQLLDDYQSSHITGTLELVPRLEMKYGRLMLSFKIGYDKKFVVKSLSKLISDIENERTETYGKNTEINHSINNFGKSIKYIDFIKKCVMDEEYIERRISLKYNLDSKDREIGSSISIFGNRADEFFNLMNGDEIEYTDKDALKSKKLMLKFGEQNPKIEMLVSPHISPRHAEFDGVNVYCEIDNIIEGSEASYYIDEDARRFNKIDKEFSSKIGPLLREADRGILDFTVGRNHLNNLFYDLLPSIEDTIEIHCDDEEMISEYLKPQGEYSFYIDSSEDNVTCKAMVSYGDETFTLIDEGKEFYREFDKEENVLTILGKWFPQTDKDRQLVFNDSDEDMLYELIESGLEKLMTLGEVFTTENFGKLKVRRKTNVAVGVAVSSGLLDLQITSEDIPEDELISVLNSYRNKKKYYRLRNGDFLDLSDSSLGAVDEMISNLGLSDKDIEAGAAKVPMYRALYLDKMLEDNESIYVNRDNHFRSIIKDFKTISESDFDEPASLEKILRNYQKKGFKWLKTIEHYNFGGILADDMGLGKTLQTITLLLSAKENNSSANPSIIISPAALVYNWGEELGKFAPELKACLITGTQGERQALIEKCDEYDVLVTSYDLVKRDISSYKEINFEYEIIDEAQYIKNHKTAAAKSVKVINSKYRFALTGTPIENRLSELWSIFDFLMPGFLYSYEEFKKNFETPIVKDHNEDKTNQLQKMVGPFVMRRLKRDVLKELPEKIEKVRFDKFEGEQQKLYDAQVLRMKNTIEGQDAGEFNKSKILILAELTRLRQICCDPSLCFEDYTGNSAKREGCMELVESAIEGGHKILLFSQFTSMLDLIEKDFRKAGISYYIITGATPKEKRVQMVNKFNEDDTNVFLISLKAGGTGLNLTGADVVIHYDPWWNIAVQNQATDRAHRIGQTKVVTEYKLIAKNTIEEKIQELQNKKKDLADQIINGDGTSLSAMSKEDILKLLEI